MPLQYNIDSESHIHQDKESFHNIHCSTPITDYCSHELNKKIQMKGNLTPYNYTRQVLKKAHNNNIQN
jgi:hypothetical protein